LDPVLAHDGFAVHEHHRHAQGLAIAHHLVYIG
jgi:hypothetical protein